MNHVIPAAAVEAAHKAICEDDFDECLEWRGRCFKAVQAATAALLAFADERDNAHGSIRSHVTTYELRKLLGASDG